MVILCKYITKRTPHRSTVAKLWIQASSLKLHIKAIPPTPVSHRMNRWTAGPSRTAGPYWDSFTRPLISCCWALSYLSTRPRRVTAKSSTYMLNRETRIVLGSLLQCLITPWRDILPIAQSLTPHKMAFPAQTRYPVVPAVTYYSAYHTRFNLIKEVVWRYLPCCTFVKDDISQTIYEKLQTGDLTKCRVRKKLIYDTSDVHTQNI